MTTKIEQVYDALTTLVETTLSEYKRFPNPYVIDANTFLHMKTGFGISIGPGNDTERFVGCEVTWQRIFTVTIVQQITTTQNNLARREIIEKDILNDHDKLMKAIYLDNSLGGKAIKSFVTDDGGVNFIDGDRLKFLAMEINVAVEYADSPT